MRQSALIVFSLQVRRREDEFRALSGPQRGIFARRYD